VIRSKSFDPPRRRLRVSNEYPAIYRKRARYDSGEDLIDPADMYGGMGGMGGMGGGMPLDPDFFRAFHFGGHSHSAGQTPPGFAPFFHQ